MTYQVSMDMTWDGGRTLTQQAFAQMDQRDVRTWMTRQIQHLPDEQHRAFAAVILHDFQFIRQTGTSEHGTEYSGSLEDLTLTVHVQEVSREIRTDEDRLSAHRLIATFNEELEIGETESLPQSVKMIVGTDHPEALQSSWSPSALGIIRLALVDINELLNRSGLSIFNGHLNYLMEFLYEIRQALIKSGEHEHALFPPIESENSFYHFTCNSGVDVQKLIPHLKAVPTRAVLNALTDIGKDIYGEVITEDQQ